MALAAATPAWLPRCGCHSHQWRAYRRSQAVMSIGILVAQRRCERVERAGEATETEWCALPSRHTRTYS
eukprot:SAG25_NODE_12875_length_274_cov_0.594286_1_plen_68_part_01